MNTRPMPPAALAGFRVGPPAEADRLLRALRDDRVPLRLHPAEDGGVPGFAAVAARVATLDAARRVVAFDVADADDPRVPQLIGRGAAVAVGLLDGVQLQFDLDAPVLVGSGGVQTLRCGWPREVWRIQRRGGFRVQPLARTTPQVELPHPTQPDDGPLTLRVIDLSVSGCALWLPADAPALPPGTACQAAVLQLDADTRVGVALRVLHVTAAADAAPHGTRLGCEWLRPDGDAQRALQRYVDQTQKKRRRLPDTAPAG